MSPTRTKVTSLLERRSSVTKKMSPSPAEIATALDLHPSAVRFFHPICYYCTNSNSTRQIIFRMGAMISIAGLVIWREKLFAVMSVHVYTMKSAFLKFKRNYKPQRYCIRYFSALNCATFSASSAPSVRGLKKPKIWRPA